MVNVFLTIDTELWPRSSDWGRSDLFREMNRDIFGHTRQGEFGITFMMDVLNAHDLKAVFFVESLFASVVGLDALRTIVGMIQEQRQEVQLHIHTEWLTRMTHPFLPNRTGQDLTDFTEDEQTLLIAEGIQNLRACGVHRLCAFRAGNFAGNSDMLRAVSRNKILFDTSYNISHFAWQWDMRMQETLLQPQQIHGVYEFPISFFRDFPAHNRPAHLTACSSAELEHMLLEGWRRGWYSVVLVLHSFELIKRSSRLENPALINPTVLNRFKQLCNFLAENRDKFRTRFFSEISPSTIPFHSYAQPLSSSFRLTASRIVEQLVGRMV